MATQETPLREAAAALRGDSDPAPGAEAPLVERLTRELMLARARIDELQRRLETVQEQRLEEARELGEVRRHREGLLFKVDYLEEKLDIAKRAVRPRRRSLWQRLTGSGSSAPD
ncbi:hypothetical protein [Rhodospirillum centenum]|uniref:Uncharacterized protein n=1 Tax=Rhodospirillum centenum (strain ATCC 51521 / SW) TaxID=414684 RepID=B6IQH6_RHOCS|nr:hypothetical protein [Rhodospirillum centenum]ACI97712.1 hypothetical protein RC1_0263 [Rhodospirillum centenum SW]